MENEVWKDVVGYEGLYQVSNLGRLKSLEKSTKFYSGYQKKICERKYPERIICKNHISNGYLQIELFKNGKVKRLTMHRIVAKTFIPNPNNYPCVNHKDGNKLNNNANNLEWCTYKQNTEHAIKTGLTKNKGKNNGFSRAVNQYDLQGNFIKKWDCIMDFYKSINKSEKSSSVSSCCSGKYKTAYGYKWKYADEELQK